MEPMHANHLNTFESLVAGERTNLIRFCAYLTGSPQAAEDLAQETLLTAWRRRDSITELNGLSRWLKAIARNVCRHWHRSQTRQSQHLFRPNQYQRDEEPADSDLADGFDLEIELERSELITLLDRAMGLLPPETRGLLIQHYIEELPQTELAAQAGLSTGTVAVRLYRGKLALRKALITDFRDDAVAYGLVTPGEAGWVETRIWCMVCGQHRLQGRFDHARNELFLRGPGCCDMTNENHMVSGFRGDELQGVKAFKPAFSRVLDSAFRHYFEQETAGMASCRECGALIPIRNGSPPWAPGFHDSIYDWCDRCNIGCGPDAWNGLALYLPQVRQFWREYPRMAGLPNRRVEIANTTAVLTGFESVTDNAKIEVAFSQDTFEVMYID